MHITFPVYMCVGCRTHQVLMHQFAPFLLLPLSLPSTPGLQLRVLGIYMYIHTFILHTCMFVQCVYFSVHVLFYMYVPLYSRTSVIPNTSGLNEIVSVHITEFVWIINKVGII